LYFFPDPQGQGSLRPTLRSVRTKGATGASGVVAGACGIAEPTGNALPLPPAPAAAARGACACARAEASA
jgi:hypothetical protein